MTADGLRHPVFNGKRGMTTSKKSSLLFFCVIVKILGIKDISNFR